MFQFFSAVAGFISSIVDYVVSFFEMLIELLLSMVRAVAWLFACIAYLPPFLTAFIVVPVSLAILMYVLFTVFALTFSLLFTGPSAYADVLATPGDASEPGPVDVVSDEPQDPGGPVAMEIYALNDAPSALSVDAADLANCVCYNVRISGSAYTLLFPSIYESSLMVDSDGNLWNVSGSSITGRLFTGEFDPSADTGLLLTMAPCLGNNFQTNHDYGSPNYIRSYYWSASDRLSYSTSYVTVQVLDTFHLYNSENLLQYVVIFLIGCCLICLWKRG